MYRKYRIVESIANSVSQYESYRDQVYRYTPIHCCITLVTQYQQPLSRSRDLKSGKCNGIWEL